MPRVGEQELQLRDLGIVFQSFKEILFSSCELIFNATSITSTEETLHFKLERRIDWEDGILIKENIPAYKEHW